MKTKFPKGNPTGYAKNQLTNLNKFYFISFWEFLETIKNYSSLIKKLEHYT